MPEVLPMKRMAMAAFTVWFGLIPSLLWAQSDFYRGKLITLIQDSTPGGVGQLRTQALIPVLQKHIPGEPKIVVQFMPGGGGRTAANHLYNNAPRDGLTIARVSSGLVTSAILGLPGVQYDIDKFIYLGSGHNEVNYVFFSRSQLGLDNLNKLKAATGLRIGGQSVGHSNYVIARLFAWLLDLKEPRFVVGFSGAEMDAALLQGELDARANSTETVVQRTPHFINERLTNFHGVAEIPHGFRYDQPAFHELPALHTFGRTDKEKRVLEMFAAFGRFSQAFVLPPGTSEERVRVLKDAFRKSWKDPEFHKNWQKMTRADASPLMPEELEQLVKNIPRDPEDIRLYNRIAGAEPLPKR
jgi:tripartite-type tricarboxylate transporter receptor subunit TctC